MRRVLALGTFMVLSVVGSGLAASPAHAGPVDPILDKAKQVVQDVCLADPEACNPGQ